MTAKDKEIFLFNPLTGELDLALKYNSDKMVTHERNEAGAPLTAFDTFSGTHLDLGPLVVIDNSGNVVSAGA
jgi:hypothetical protein